MPGGTPLLANLSQCSIIPGRPYRFQAYAIDLLSIDSDENGHFFDVEILVAPSNDYEFRPSLDKSPEFFSVELTVDALYGGRLYLFVIEAGTFVDYWNIRNFPNKYPPDGSRSCTNSYPILAGGVPRVSVMQACNLQRSVHYQVITYVEGPNTDPVRPDGMLLLQDHYIDFVFPAVFQTNYFSRTPKIISQSLSRVEFEFVPRYSGFAWWHIVRREDYYACYGLINSTASAIKGGHCAVSRSPNCLHEDVPVTALIRVTRSVSNDNTELTNCGLKVGSEYNLMVYLEGTSNVDLGHHYFAPVYIPPSNTFGAFRIMETSVHAEGLRVMVNMTKPGKFYAAVDVAETAAAVLTELKCILVTQPYVADSALDGAVLDIGGCSLSVRAWHRLVGYAVDSAAGVDGQIATLDFYVVSSNGYYVYPVIDEFSFSDDGFDVALQANSTGRLWAYMSTSVTQRNFSTAIGALACRFQGVSVDASLKVLSFRQCELTNLTSVFLVVYVEDANGRGDGTTSSQLVDLEAFRAFYQVLISNVSVASGLFLSRTGNYAHNMTSDIDFNVSIVALQAQPTVRFSFQAASEGLLWAAVTRGSIDPYKEFANLPAGGDVLCRLDNLTVTSHFSVLEINDCDLRTSSVYRLYVYIRRKDLSGRGNYEWVYIHTEPAIQFTTPLFLKRTPRPGQAISFWFNVSRAGLAFAVVSEVLDTLKVRDVVSGSAAIHGSCFLANLTVSAASDNSFQFPNCSPIVLNRQYMINVYASISQGLDGSLASLPLFVAHNFNNFFEEYPMIEAGDFQQLSFGFRAKSPDGYVYAGIWPRGFNPSRRQVRTFSGSLGSSTCKRGARIDHSYKNWTFSVCNLTADFGGEYDLIVYVEKYQDQSSHLGDLIAVPFSPLKSNRFYTWPYVSSTLAPEEVRISFVSELPGHAWARIVPSYLPVRLPDVTSSDLNGCSANHSISGYPTLSEFAFTDCRLLEPQGTFAAYIYVAGSTASLTGSLSSGLPLYIKKGVTNTIMSAVEVFHVSTDGATVRFTVEKDGFCWAVIAYKPYCVDASQVVSGSAGVGSDLCKMERFPVSALQIVELVLHGCRLEAHNFYHVFIYVTSKSGLAGGQLSHPVEFWVASTSNSFSIYPRLVGTPGYLGQVNDSIAFTARGREVAGRLHAVAGPAEAIRNMTISSLLNYTERAATCLLAGVPITGASISTFTLRNCSIQSNRKYGLIAYISSGSVIGELAKPLYFTIPNQWAAIAFQAYPVLLDPVATEGVRFMANVTAEGLLWASISRFRDLSVSDIVNRRRAECCLLQPASTRPFLFTYVELLTCQLPPGEDYFLHAYVDRINLNNASLLNDTGDLAPPLLLSAYSAGYGTGFMKLGWDAFGDAISPYLPVTAWKIYANSEPITPLVQTANATLEVVVSCSVGVEYYYQVQAFNPQGWGPLTRPEASERRRCA